MKKLIIFDLDGVLVDACEWHRVSLNKALKEVCNYEISLKDHYDTFNGIPTRVKLDKLTAMGVVLQEQHQEIYDKKQDLTVITIEELATIREEKIHMIRSLKEMGCVVACYTNSIRKTANLMLQKTGVLKYLDYVLTNQDVHNSKPHPEGYLFLVDKFKFNKEDVIIVEDSPKGLAAAYASGCNVIEVKNPDCVDISLFKEFLK
tara:strand:- start:3015 stop:3626 length:612 start_codon:yes stop_codon:yes gene_type:complete